MIPTVSIISPTYNHQNYISECIQSVIDQTLTEWEMIIVDDGSTDNTLNICREFEKKDNRIRVLTQENTGIFKLSETYNRALKLAQGNYIAILEGDDYWGPDKLKLQVELLDRDMEVVLCWGQAKCVSSDGNTIYNIYPDAKSEESDNFNNDPVGKILNVLLYKDWIPALTIMIRKNVLVKAGGFVQISGLPAVDLPTIMQLSLVGKFGFVPKQLGCWRNYLGQITKIYPAAIREGYLNLVEDFLIKNKDNNFVNTINTKKVVSFHHRQLIIAYSRSGRYKLIRGEFSDARRDYVHSIFLPGGEYIWKLRSLTGLFFSLFHLDIEWLARLLHRPTYGK